jgi:hypothetical protein
VTLFETEPLSAAQLAAIGGWPGREGIYTAQESLLSYRLTAERTINGGSKHVRYFQRRPAYLPPGPFRWLGVRALLGVVNGIDAWRSRQILRRGIGR